jgi:transposase-like protein
LRICNCQVAKEQLRARNQAVYAVVFIDAIHVKIREGQVANRPVYLALGVTVDGERDVLGLRAGEHGDGEGCTGCGS